MGYHRAGFEVVGVDISPQPHYPFTFVQADALAPPFNLTDFDLVHASPPCQAYTSMSNRWRGKGTLADARLDLVGATRAVFNESGTPWVIENVRGAPLAGFTLTGEMFGLGVHRPRIFEASWLILVPEAPPPFRDSVPVYGKSPDGRRLWTRVDGTELRAASSVDEASVAMGIDWLPWHELKESIPPAYTEFIGRAFMEGR